MPRRVVSTLVNDRPGWADRVTMVDRSALPSAHVLRRLVGAAARGCRLVVLGSAGYQARYVDLLAAAAVARLPRRPEVVISECTWEPGSAALARRMPGAGNAAAVARMAIRALDGEHATFCVLSRDERARFPQTWGIDASRVVFTPFTVTLPDQELQAPAPWGETVFAGGDSLRDYAPLLDAATAIPAPIVVATSRVEPGPRLARNVRAGRIPHDEYVRELRSARVVVVPLARNRWRSAGQQTYLNAMALGKPVVVTDAMGVRDYVEHGLTGLVVPPGDARAMAEAVRWTLDPRNEDAVRAMAAHARRVAGERYSLDRYLSGLLRVAAVTAERRAG